MNELSVLHLSDLHIDSSNGTYSRLLKGLLKDIEQQIKHTPPNSLIVVVTGDTIHKGDKKASFVALRFFVDLKKVLKDKVVGIYIVPGNHDKFRTKANDVLIPACRSLVLEDNAIFNRDFYENFWKFQLDTYAETNGSGYLELVQRVYEVFGVNSNNSFVDNTFGVDLINVQGKNFCFVLLNTAWSCLDDNDNRKLVLGKFQIEQIKHQYHQLTDSLEENERPILTLVLGHHPISFLQGKEEDNIFSEMISFEELDANAYLCGHTHDRTIINWVNQRHTLNTFMTGIGWPENPSGHHVGQHTYSIYVFNTSANSIDIYVRSTDDGGSFSPDFRIYTNEIEKSKEKIVFPIRSQTAQAYIPLSVGPFRNEKAYYISDEFLKYIYDYNIRIGRFRQAAGTMIESSKIDFFQSLSIYEDNQDVLTSIFDYLFVNKSCDSADNSYKIATQCLETNKEVLYDSFLGFLQRLCQKLQYILFGEDMAPNEVVRFHFRYLADRNSYLYSKLCASLPDNLNSADYELSDMKYGELIEAAYKTNKSLIYSVNRSFCSNPLKEKWNNFITIIPMFSGNRFDRKVNETSTKSVPFITFGVTTNSNRFDEFLYCLDYFSMNRTLEEILDSYLKIFKIDISDFCIWVKNQFRLEGTD